MKLEGIHVFKLTWLKDPRFVFSEDEFVALRKEEEEGQRLRHEQTLASIPAAEITEEMRIFKPSRLHFTELYEEDALESLETRLKKYHLLLNNYLIANGCIY